MRALLLSFVLTLVWSGIAFAQFEGAKQTYSSPDLKNIVSGHKSVAILPYETSITYKRTPKNYDAAANREEELSVSKNLQHSMFTYLLRKESKYSVSFQDVDRTNALLKANGIYDKLDLVTADSICKVLGVDAVIKCRFSYEKTASEAGAIVKTLLIGGMGSKTGSGALTMQINDKKSGGMIWRFYKAMDDNVMASSDQLMERMMRKVSRNFPYEK